MVPVATMEGSAAPFFRNTVTPTEYVLGFARIGPQLAPSPARSVFSTAHSEPIRKCSPVLGARTTPSPSRGRNRRRPATESSPPASFGEYAPPLAPTPPPNLPKRRYWTCAGVHTTDALRKTHTAADSNNHGNSRDRSDLPDGRTTHRRWRPDPKRSVRELVHALPKTDPPITHRRSRGPR